MARGERPSFTSHHSPVTIPIVFAKLLLLFIIVPLVELYLLVVIGSRLTWPVTLGIIIVTGFLGAALAKSQGARDYPTFQRLAAFPFPLYMTSRHDSLLQFCLEQAGKQPGKYLGHCGIQVVVNALYYRD